MLEYFREKHLEGLDREEGKSRSLDEAPVAIRTDSQKRNE
jgi:hypothetical protein